MNIVERLETKKAELKKQYDSLSYASVPKSILKKKIEMLTEMINAYNNNCHNNHHLPLSLDRVQRLLEQHYGLEEQKQKILHQLEINEFQRRRGIKTNKTIWCLVGPVGTGKTTLVKILAQVFDQNLVLCALGGMTESTLLTGKEEEIGLLANSLLKTNSANPLILLDEIDKVSARVQDSLLCFLDNEQNTNIFNHYLDTSLDFSQVTFVVTANDLKKVPDAMRSRMMIIELPEYNFEQKKIIAQKIIQKWFHQNSNSLNSNNFEITPNAVETLINKTQEKGVRQLKTALDNIFNHCLLQWAREEQQEKPESKIIVDSNLINELFPHNFANIDQESDKARLKQLQKELENMENENKRVAQRLENQQEKLEKIKTKFLLITQRNHQILGYEAIDYQKEIKNATSWEELQVIKDEILLKIKQKIVLRNANKKADTRRKALKKRIEELEKKVTKNQVLQKPEKFNWSIKSPWFISFVLTFVLMLYKNNKQKSK